MGVYTHQATRAIEVSHAALAKLSFDQINTFLVDLTAEECMFSYTRYCLKKNAAA